MYIKNWCYNCLYTEYWFGVFKNSSDRKKWYNNRCFYKIRELNNFVLVINALNKEIPKKDTHKLIILSG